MNAGGFDIVLGNPPWERIKLQEQEFFAAREPEIAEAPNAAARGRLIAALKAAPPGSREARLHTEFELAKRTAEASSVFARLTSEDLGRFPLAGRGDVNTYALFAELFSVLTNSKGCAGVIVPTGIATDATTAPFFSALVEQRRLARLIDFENRDAIFPTVHRSYKFSLLTLASGIESALFTFFLTDTAQLAEPDRTFRLSPAQIALMNPNTKTAPVFRTTADAELTARIYQRVPVLIQESQGKAGNPWGISFSRLFDMSNDSGLFTTAETFAEGPTATLDGNRWSTQPVEPAAARELYLPLYEAKLIHHYDYRWATYDGLDPRDTSPTEHRDSTFEITPRYWVHEREVRQRLSDRHWGYEWLMGWRDICRATDERTIIASLFPLAGVGNKLPLMFCEMETNHLCGLIGNLSALCFDYVARQKQGGTTLNFFIYEQLPVLPPAAYTLASLDFIAPRVLELTYTSGSLTPFARDLGYEGDPFHWDEDRRALLRAELDAWYARGYGLTRDELRYILDPADVMSHDYPSETFRVLKEKEIKLYKEYRTQRLVLDAWDRMERGELHKPEPYQPPAADAAAPSFVLTSPPSATDQHSFRFSKEASK